MEKKLFGIVLLLLLLLTHELMVLRVEAIPCRTRSKHFHGRCLLQNHTNNCMSVCRLARFTTGHCRHGKCYCYTKCGGQHGYPGPFTRPHPPEEGFGGPGGDEGGGQEGYRHPSTHPHPPPEEGVGGPGGDEGGGGREGGDYGGGEGGGRAPPFA